MIDQIASIYPFNRRRLHIQAYQNILEDSKKVLKSCSGLIFLHFPIPHPPVIYNRDSERLTTRGLSNISGYLDNLGLVDRAFRQLRLTLQDRGVWDETAVIISSDHPWRDAAIATGKDSLYVPFLLKMPHQSERIELDDIVFETVNTADLVLAILKGEVSTPEQAVAWIDAHSQKIKN
jgi:arylsulfatase A-like enzyme